VAQTAVRATATVTSPLDGSVLGVVAVQEPAEVQAALARARAAQPAWAATPLIERCRIVNRFRDLVITHADELMDLIHQESGKSRINALEEVLDTALTAAYYASNAPRWLAPRARVGAIPLLTTAVERYQPKGVVGIISPWNFPLTLAVSDAIPALLAGNTVVLKPDSATPLTALAGLDWLRRAGLPASVMQIVTGPGTRLGPPLVDAVDHLMFTGSTAVGRTLGARCGERLISFSAELGGKNALLVLADADLQRTALGAVQACFAVTGQLCVSIERVYVHQSVYEPFVAQFVERTRALRLGTGAGWDVDLGPLISTERLRAVAAHVDDAVARAATVLAGGRARPDLGPTFYEPTILAGVRDDMLVARHETFGPVVSVYPVSDDAAAIAAANDTEFGLNASVWSASLPHARRVARQLRAGTVNINEGYAAAWASHGAPMGGFGASGLGRRHGREGIIKYTEPQTIATQHRLALGPPPGVPRTTYAAVMLAAARVLHRRPVRLPGWR